MCRKTAEICTRITYFISECNSVLIIFFTVLVCSTSWPVAGPNSGASCNMIKAKGVIIADCASKGLNLNVPQNLEKQIQVLNLSRNNVVNISDYSFDRYKDSLISLDMSFLKERTVRGNELIDCRFEYNIEAFSKLHKLEYLDLTSACWNKKFILPQKIKILRIENCSSVMNVSYLKFLEELHAAGNGWDCSPMFHNLAPLKFVDLRRNALLTFEIERIAPFCDLEILRLDAFPSKNLKKELLSEKTYCACKAIDYWLINAKVEHDHWNCFPPQSTSFAPKCNLVPEKEVMKLRRECLSRKIYKSLIYSITWWMIPAVLMILMGLLISALIVNGIKKALKRARSRRDHDDEEEEEED